MIDLHTHSTFSDGSLTPEKLVQEAVRAGLAAVALTDHDNVAGVPGFLSAAAKMPLRAISGVEISADFRPGTMHILGYFVDPNSEPLEEALKWIREGRELRNEQILKKLVELGLKITWDEVKSYAGEDVVGRPHFAQALLARGYVRSKDEAFERYLGKGKAAYADRRRFSPTDCIRLIREAGGVAVLAHPFTLGISLDELRFLLRQLKDSGLGGVEAIYTEHTAEMRSAYEAMARALDLVVTGGSDFHGALMPDIKLGRGFGNLEVPDVIVEQLEARKARQA